MSEVRAAKNLFANKKRQWKRNLGEFLSSEKLMAPGEVEKRVRELGERKSSCADLVMSNKQRPARVGLGLDLAAGAGDGCN